MERRQKQDSNANPQTAAEAARQMLSKKVKSKNFDRSDCSPDMIELAYLSYIYIFFVQMKSCFCF